MIIMNYMIYQNKFNLSKQTGGNKLIYKIIYGGNNSDNISSLIKENVNLLMKLEVAKQRLSLF